MCIRDRADGVPFAVSSNGVVLTPGVDSRGELPLSYVFLVQDAKGDVVWRP